MHDRTIVTFQKNIRASQNLDYRQANTFTGIGEAGFCSDENGRIMNVIGCSCYFAK